ncbi:benzoate/H(+) symporter BenE family transporter [Brevundimonas sp. 3P9-tot-E]|jgi:benzoate membrane transport protein|uniref:benzoate/H(+) symporter BenE family transporter n=1 Tax=Brevundimonas TaxID=41275 RepID=UPI002897363D|nr:benzoate/H(+) symporter BenE family transporter [Brevundimonas diminuta]
MTLLSRWGRDISLSATLAGVIATVISFSGPLVIVFQAAAGLGPDRTESWIWAIAIGSGLLGIGLSVRYRVPVVIAWSAPGSALLVSQLPGLAFEVAVGAYVVANLIVLTVGLTGAFDKIVARLPSAITAAMLAGILLRFIVGMADAVGSAPILALIMIGVYFSVRLWAPRYALVAVVFAGGLVAASTDLLEGAAPSFAVTVPVWTTPRFEWQAVASIAVPLAVMSLSGQFLPGFAVLRAAGYDRPESRPVIASSAIGSILLAPFGCHGLNLAAFTAAICLGPEAHKDPGRRYIAGVSGGLAYLVFGVFAGAVMGLFALLPPALIAVLAGLALFPVVAASLAEAVEVSRTRDAAVVTFAVSASGLTFLGLGAAFWGLILGLAIHSLMTVHAVRAREG